MNQHMGWQGNLSGPVHDGNGKAHFMWNNVMDQGVTWLHIVTCCERQNERQGWWRPKCKA